MMDSNGPVYDFALPAGSSYYGSELYREPFRWDQRFYAFVLRFNGANTSGQAAPKQPAIAPMAQATGGHCVTVPNMKQLFHSFDCILGDHSSRKPVTVAMQFEALILPNTPNTPPAPLIQHVCVRTPTGTWPLPEDFPLSPTMTSLPPRLALPRLMYRTIPIVQPKAPMPQFPIDVYELEDSPLVSWITTFVAKGYALECSLVSGREGVTPDKIPPFGVLAHCPDGVKLFVMPYNFQQLYALLFHYQSRTLKWKADFDKYLTSIPQNYVGPLKAALRNLPMPPTPVLSGPPVHPVNLVPDTMVAQCKELPPGVVTWLNNLKERAQSGRATFLTEISNARKVQQLSQQTGSSSTFSSVLSSSRSGGTFARSDLLLQMEVLRSRLHVSPQMKHQALTTRNEAEEAKHHVPISEMGDYQTYLAKKPGALRAVEGEAPPDRPYFGNPFTKGDAGGLIDEVGVSSATSTPINRKKRKRKFGVGERADKMKQFMITQAEKDKQASLSPPPSASSSASSSSSSTAYNTPPSTPSLPSTPVPTSPNIESSKSFGGTLSSAHAFIEQQRARKENLSKWEKSSAASEAIAQQQQASIVSEPKSPLELLKIAHANNALKLAVLAAIQQPVGPDEMLLRKCWSELKGSAETKRRAVQEWILLGQFFRVDLTPVFQSQLKC